MLRQTVDLVEGIAPPPTGKFGVQTLVIGLDGCLSTLLGHTGELEPGHRVEARVTELDKGVFWFPGPVVSFNFACKRARSFHSLNFAGGVASQASFKPSTKTTESSRSAC
jgi:hypothetical protein